MARLPVMDIVRLSFEDLSAYKGLAAVLYGILLATSLGIGLLAQYLASIPVPLEISLPSAVDAMVFSAALYRFAFLSLMPALISMFVMAWVNMQWADWVASRTERGELHDGRYWTSFLTLLKYWAIVIALLGTGVALMQSGEHSSVPVSMLIGAHQQVILLPETTRQAALAALMRTSAAGGPAKVLGFLVSLLGIWAMVRLLLLPARGAIGEGASLVAYWQSTRGFFWSLLRLMLVFAGLFLFGAMLSGVLFAMIAFVAVDAGWIAAPLSLTPAGLSQWMGLPTTQALSMVRSVLFAPVSGTVFFIFIGSIMRAALLLQREEGRSAYARAMAAWPPEKSLWQ